MKNVEHHETDDCCNLEIDYEGIGSATYARLQAMGMAGLASKGFIPTDAAEDIRAGIKAAQILLCCTSHGIPVFLAELFLDMPEIEIRTNAHMTLVCKAIIQAAIRAEALQGEKV